MFVFGCVGGNFFSVLLFWSGSLLFFCLFHPRSHLPQARTRTMSLETFVNKSLLTKKKKILGRI